MNDFSPGSTLSVTSAEVCDRGKVREENQDNVRNALIPMGRLFIVADGIGGYQGGATASRMVVEGFSTQLAERPASYPADRAIQEACDYTNTSIHSAASSSDAALQRMGSTVVLAIVQMTADGGAVAWIGHVGDSRAYLVRDGRMQKLTNDHSAVQALLNRNLITEEEARHHPDASVLTRSLGHRPEVEIEIDRIELHSGDGLMLCSDGLWGYVADAEISAAVTDASLSVQTTAETLLQLALAAGGQDNIGIEFIRIADAASSLRAGPSDSSATEMRSSHRKQQMLAIGLLLLGGFGGLGYLAYSQGWFPQINGFLHKDGKHKSQLSVTNQPAPGNPLPGSHEGRTITGLNQKASEPERRSNLKKIAVVGDVAEAVQEHKPPPGAHLWQHISIKRTERPACALRARPAATVIYSDTGVDMEEALDQHSELRPWIKGQRVETHKMDSRVKKDCGDVDIVVILPDKKPTTAPANEAPESSRPTEQQTHPSQQPSQDPTAEILWPFRFGRFQSRLPESA